MIRQTEKWAAAAADQTITLSKSDQSFVLDAGWVPQQQACTFLPPGIRADVAALPLPPDIPARAAVPTDTSECSHTYAQKSQIPASHVCTPVHVIIGMLPLACYTACNADKHYCQCSLLCTCFVKPCKRKQGLPTRTYMHTCSATVSLYSEARLVSLSSC